MSTFYQDGTLIKTFSGDKIPYLPSSDCTVGNVPSSGDNVCPISLIHRTLMSSSWQRLSLLSWTTLKCSSILSSALSVSCCFASSWFWWVLLHYAEYLWEPSEWQFRTEDGVSSWCNFETFSWKESAVRTWYVIAKTNVQIILCRLTFFWLLYHLFDLLLRIMGLLSFWQKQNLH